MTRLGVSRLPKRRDIADMRDFAVAIGLVLAIEGLFLAAFPGLMKKSMLEAAQQAEGVLRFIGLIAACFGVAAIFVTKRFL